MGAAILGGDQLIYLRVVSGAFLLTPKCRSNVGFSSSPTLCCLVSLQKCSLVKHSKCKQNFKSGTVLYNQCNNPMETRQSKFCKQDAVSGLQLH